MDNPAPASKDGKLQSMPKELIDWVNKPLGRFFRIETAAAGILLAVTILAMLLANSPWSAQYLALWQVEAGINLGPFGLHLTLLEWINDAVMTLFFFVVSLELKRELVLGELRQPRQAMLSVSAAIGGMAVPAVLYLLMLWGAPGAHGWGMVMATDTAFVIGCLALLGRRIPVQLRVFLLSLAIVDDIGAILVVAVGYGEALNYQALALAAAGIMVIRGMALLGIRNLMLYFLMGAAIWLAVEHSGIHPTVTGVVLGLMTPTLKWVSDARLHQILDAVIAHPPGQNWSGDTLARMKLRTAESAAREALSPVERLEIVLHPWVGFVIMPLFAFANAGVPVGETNVTSPLTLAILLGLVLGKPLGIFLFSWLAVKLNIAARPVQLSWSLIAAGGCLCGIGFTMALFIAGLAFSPIQINEAKFGILLASAISALAGMLIIKLTSFPQSLTYSSSEESVDFTFDQSPQRGKNKR
ncbi:Na+/H+ antiporter NhaA [Bowmanella yangjiangensis]|uniref:Na(+)/H(+) antiporter NhaA n=1 Tax=Bowmanella yangjiangensis TaxID=2811230 RepID=A0ABS3CNU9_9ALTE|nr:Na+/H+ antiporter NhaA [Bowmanella yangjiangensis]MBN7818385.1 Na+/H+ antiporter NhaA [Bowmanella yangjiangensis]